MAATSSYAVSTARPIAALLARAAHVIALLLVLSVPLSNVVMISGVGTVSRTVGLVFLGVSIPAIIGSRRFSFHPAHVAMFLFVAWNFASLMWSWSLGASVPRIVTYAQLFGGTLLLYQWLPDRQAVHRAFSAYIIGASISAGLILKAFVQAEYLGGYQYQRFAAPNFDPNGNAVILVLGIPIAWYMFLSEKGGRLRLLYLIYPVAASLAAVLTASRTGFVVGFLALFYVFLTRERTGSGAMFRNVLIVVGAVVLVMQFAPSYSIDRLGTTRRSIQEESMNGRVTVLQAGLKQFVKEPVLGIGVGSWMDVMPPTMGKGKGGFGGAAAHNAYLEAAVELGFLGLLAFVGMLLTQVWYASRMPKDERRLWMTILAILFTTFLAINWGWFKPPWLMMGLLVAHRTALRRERFEQEQSVRG